MGSGVPHIKQNKHLLTPKFFNLKNRLTKEKNNQVLYAFAIFCSNIGIKTNLEKILSKFF
jgi:hypothetical protein